MVVPAHGMDEALMTQILIHEWAHVLSIDYHGNEHDAVWGLAMSEVYELVMGHH